MKKIVDISAETLLSFSSVGFQSLELERAVSIMKSMTSDSNCSVFFAFTSNLVASGLRGLIKEIAKRKLADVFITAGGSIDHDIMKSITEGYVIGDFSMDDAELHKKGINRLGNILIPNDRYERLEEFMNSLFSDMVDEYGQILLPSDICSEAGKRLGDDSFLYWCQRNSIPVFCPGIVDSAIGLNAYFFKKRRKDFGIEVSGDLERLGNIVLNAESTGGIILGGGISKHHAIASNILRGGFNKAVYFTTSSEYDGSLSGARDREAVSWGKIRETANRATVVGDATITFPIAFYLTWG